MNLQILNSLTGKKEPFIPLTQNKILFYMCGVTVYDYCHIGHARAYVAFDTIRRYLIHLGFNVRYIQNFTDIDDKIINRSNELGIPFSELTEKYIKTYFSDMDRLNILRATEYPRATQFINEMQILISTLIKKNTAYISQGDVWFSVPQFKKYGKLSKKILDDLQIGARVDTIESKHNPMDFVLWKAAKPNEPSWNSPWGAGRPGWHTECSAMAMKLLGPTIDIHGGGEDLIFPHHENEIAQSESATGKPFAKYWIHNGFVNINEEKMSKSKKNFYTIDEILKKYSGEVLRFFLLKVHYRSPLNFSFEGLEEAKIALERLHHTIQNIPHDTPIDLRYQPQFQELENAFHQAMNDDFNAAKAIGFLFDINKLINKTQQGVEILIQLGKILGLFFEQDTQNTNDIPPQIQEWIRDRTEAKKTKNFKKADQLRELITNEGYKIEDTPQGTRITKN